MAAGKNYGIPQKNETRKPSYTTKAYNEKLLKNGFTAVSDFQSIEVKHINIREL